MLTIFVLDKGFVQVGIPSQDPNDFDKLILTKTAIIRVWGTTDGLGQLAMEGPQQSTILDKEPDGVTISKSYTIKTIPCNEENWNDYLSN